MSIQEKLRSRRKTLLTIAPEYGELSRIYMDEYVKTGQATQMVKSLEFHFREKIAYEQINWIDELLRGES